MPKSVMLDKSFEFATEIVRLCDKIKNSKNEYVLTRQLMKSGTSIGANIYESKYAQSKADFVSKMKIALKECYETEYWLKLMHSTDYISDGDYSVLANSCGSIRRMLISSVNTVENNNKS